MRAPVLEVLGAYLAFGGGALLLVHRFIVPLSRRAAGFLVAVPLLLTGRAVFSGSVYAPLDIAYQAPPLAALKNDVGIEAPQTPVLGDVVTQQIPWRRALREAVKNMRPPLWNRFILAGEPLLGAQQPAVLHPFPWIGMLLPLAHAWTLEMTLGSFLALLSGFLFFRDLGLAPVASAFGAVGWAFSNFLVFFAGYPLGAAAAPFPLVLLGLARIARRPDATGFATTTAALYLMSAAGHSETMLHVTAAAGVWFLFCLGSGGTSAPPGTRGRAVLLALAAGAAALGLVAAVLLPHLEALPQTLEYAFRHDVYAHSKKSVSFAAAFSKLQQAVVPYAFGVSGRGATSDAASALSLASVGALLLPFAALGTASRDRRKCKWMFVAMTVVGLAIWAGFPGIADLVGALPLFDIAINDRLAFVGGFGLAALAALGVDGLARTGDLRRAAWPLAAAGAGLFGAFLLVRPRLVQLAMPEEHMRRLVLLQIVPIAAALVLVVLSNRRRSAAFLIAILGLLLAERALEASDVYPVAPERAFFPALPLLDPIPRGEPFRMAGVGYTFIPNISAMYGLEDVRGYEAMTFLPLFRTYDLWCVHQPVWFNRIDDPTRPFLSFLNVRYFVTGPGAEIPAGWRVLSQSRLGSLIENPRVLPRVFAPEEIDVETDPARQLSALARIPDFARTGVVDAADGRAAGRRYANGGARVSIRSYDAQSIRVTVIGDARETRPTTVVGTSIPAWKGWQLTIDGRPGRLRLYNHAFLAFEAPAGTHDVRLTYAPVSFAVGAGISLATAAALLLLGSLAGFARLARLRAVRITAPR